MMLMRLKKFFSDNVGAIAPAMALLIPVVITAVGVSVDLSRAYLVHDRLGRALDASALAAASSSGDEDFIEQRFEDYFNANYPEGLLGDPFNVVIDADDTEVRVSADANVEMAFMSIVGIDSITVSAHSTVRKELRGLEVAMVLDNTGSMWSGNNIGSLRTAATSFVNILYDRVEDDNQVTIAIVPYAASVNVGAAAPAIVDNPYVVNWVGTQYAPYSTTDWSAWRGCVFERAYPNDIHDTSIAVGGRWRPYRWPDTASSGTPWDNNWRNDNGTLNLSYPNPNNSDNNFWRHPNLGCPTPIIPLQSNRSQLVTEISRLSAWNRGGTLGHIGMAWGIRVLSPEEPFTQGHEYDDEMYRKVMVMMTDGDNVIYCQNDRWQGGCNDNRSDETAYRRVSANVLGTTSRAAATTEANERLEEVCEYAKGLGITIYTITFSNSLNNATRAIYQNCASDYNKYYNAPTQGDLEDAFEQISRELSNLHLSE
jgi:Flp pilus assembly protein TadG